MSSSRRSGRFPWASRRRSGARTPPVDLGPIDEVPAAPPPGARASLARAVASVATVKWASQAFTWAATLVVARLLTPHDYGIVALAGVYLGLIVVLNDFGLGLAVVAYRELTDTQVAQLNGLAVVVGAAAVALSCAAALPLGHVLGVTELPPVMATLSAVLLVTSLRTVAVGRLQKDLRFGRLAVADGVQAVSTAATTLVLALAGLQYWALVLGLLLGHVITTVLTLAWVPPRFARPRARSLREVLTFSRHILVGRLAWFVQTRTDVAVVGWTLGGTALGVYSVAASLGRLPVEKVSALLSQVSPAFLASNQDDRPALRRLIVTLTQALAFTVLPICGGMLLVGPGAVALALGNQWLDVAGPLQVFAIVAAFDSIGAVLSSVLVVTGGARLLMYIGLGGAVAMPAAYYLGTQWGLVGVAAAYAIVSPLMRVTAYLGVSRRTGLSFAEYRRALGPALSATSVMVLVVLGVRMFVPQGWSLAPRLALEMLSGALTYILLLVTIYRPRVAEFYRVFRGVRASHL